LLNSTIGISKRAITHIVRRSSVAINGERKATERTITKHTSTKLETLMDAKRSLCAFISDFQLVLVKPELKKKD
jgi:ribosomal protein L25 (general stress protein Ctc)